LAFDAFRRFVPLQIAERSGHPLKKHRTLDLFLVLGLVPGAILAGQSGCESLRYTRDRLFSDGMRRTQWSEMREIAFSARHSANTDVPLLPSK
jgi:hypothetical protein